MSETWRLALWTVWAWLALIHVVYYTSRWSRQRRREAERARPIQLPKVPTGPAPGARCNAYALGCQCWQCVARDKRDHRMFCEEHTDPGLMDHWP
jgi:hypothetical protein